MRDINDNFEIVDTNLFKARNVLITQLGSLYYQPELGINIEMFITSGIAFQESVFRTHVIEQLIANNVVLSSLEPIAELFETIYDIKIAGDN